ncbi:MAG TPA: hypothetical protein VFT51_14045 [Bacillales bacterium]|nr:hypothetical protein [Bacillales bacterium]
MRKGLFFICILMLTILSACAQEQSNTETYTVEEAVKDGHVVVKHLSSQPKQVLNGAIETKNLKMVFKFQEKVDQKKKAKVKISIFDKNGSSKTSTLQYDGKVFHFENNYPGYQSFPGGSESSPGIYQCQYLFMAHGRIELHNCEDQEEKKHGRVIVFLSEVDKFQDLRDKFMDIPNS